MSLKKKTVKGLFWSSITLFFTRGIGFLCNIILSRILFPEDFGIVALSFMTVNILYMFQELGMGNALIYEKENTKKAANVCFYLTIVNSIVLCILLYFTAPFIAVFFKEVRLACVLRFLIIPLFISSLAVTPQNLINKNMEFKKNFYPELISNFAYIFIALMLAWKGYGYWSIIYAYISQICISTFLYFVIAKWLPTLELNYNIFKRMFHYSKYILGTSFIVFISTNIDNAMIGRLVDSAALGYYYMAYNIANITATTVIPVVSKVSFSLFCNIKNKEDGLKISFLKVLELTMLVVMPITVGLFIFSTHFVHTVFGERWMPIVVLIQILCWLGLLRTLGSCSSVIFNSIGKTNLLFITNFIFTALGICLMYPFTKYFKQIGTAQAVIIQSLIGMPIIFYISIKLIDIKDKELIDILKAPVIGSICLGVIGYLLKKMIFSALNWHNFLILVSVSAVIYCGVVYLIKKEVVDDIKMIFEELVDKPR